MSLFLFESLSFHKHRVHRHTLGVYHALPGVLTLRRAESKRIIF